MNDKILSTVFQVVVFVAAVLVPSASRGNEEAPPSLKVGLYESTLSGVGAAEAVGRAEPMVQLLSRQIKFPVSLNTASGKTPKDLARFGKAIEEGTWHLGVIWGLEYGWLKQEKCCLELAAIVTPGGGLAYRCEVLVRPDSTADDIKDLKETRLAVCERAPLMERLYLAKMLSKDGHNVRTYFSDVKPYGSVWDAILAVHDKTADCVVVNTASLAQFKDQYRDIETRSVASSKPFPEIVIVGRPDVVNRLRKDLWRDVCGRLETINETAEGRGCVRHWNVVGFICPSNHPDISFEKLVQERVSDYPVELLEGLWTPPPREDPRR